MTVLSVAPLIDRRQRERRSFFHRQQFPSSVDKPTRAQAIRGRFSQGKVFLPRSAPWVADLVAEMLTFPSGRNDDQVDVLSLFGRMLAVVPITKRNAGDTWRVKAVQPL